MATYTIATPPLVYLTPRQRQILALAALEHTTEDIARLIDREPKTVENHLANIYQKLHVRSRVGAVLKAINLGELPNAGDKWLSLESIEEHAQFMTEQKHLKGVPKAIIDEGTGQRVVDSNDEIKDGVKLERRGHE